MRNEQAITHLEKWGRNPNYLSSTQLKKKRLSLSNDINSIVETADIIILCIPAAFLDGELKTLTHSLKNKVVVSAVKGVIPENLQIVGDYLHTQWQVPYHQIGVIAGPSHAEEVAMEKLSYLTIACQDQKQAEFVASLLTTSYVRTKNPMIFLEQNMQPC